MQERTLEWLHLSEQKIREYHKKQFIEPYRSTVLFHDWLISSGINLSEGSICDLGCGEGANLFYLAKHHPKAEFTGIDLNSMLIKSGREILNHHEIQNVLLEQADLYNLPTQYTDKFNGLLSFQTLSWLPDFELPIRRMALLNPDWIALTSLFYDGDVNCRIQVQDYSEDPQKNRARESFYNIYSLSLVERLFGDLGYGKFSYAPFEIDIDLPKPANKGMGSYTVKTAEKKRLQISGPLLMSWYFLLARKN